MPYFVYMMATKKDGVIYTGVTSDLARRAYEHRDGIKGGFTKLYFVKRLVYFEAHDDINEAILQEKRLKKWRRDWKAKLIEQNNPEWKDLSEGL